MNPQITKVERIAPRIVRVNHQKDMSWREFFLWLAFIAVVVGLTLLVHLTIEPKLAHAETKLPTLYDKSDKEQEAEYCRQIGKGTEVRGATVSQIELHCMTR